jgi:tetratricopeptide (TPR) repeat protein
MNASLDQPIPTAVAALPECPYKGLDFFEDSRVDQMLFAGRESDIEEVLARIVTQRVFVIYGRSGLGKTSLLLSGIFPRLRERGFQPFYVRTVGTPLNDLAEIIRPDLAKSGGPSSESLIESVAHTSKSGTVVLVFDQFEEFFIQFRERLREIAGRGRGNEEGVRLRAELTSEREKFVDLVSHLVNEESLDVRVVFSLREDHLAALDDFQRQLPDLFKDAYRLLPLTAFGARQAIVQPLIQAGIPYDNRLVTHLLDELAAFEFDSARLQITCLELFRLAKAKGKDAPRIKDEYLVELKESRGNGLERVFHRYLENAVSLVPPARRLSARVLLDSLITSERTKRALTLAELMEFKVGDGAQAETDLREVLGQLCAQKVIRPPGKESIGRYELIHECLIPEILKWLEGDKDFAGFRRARDMVTVYSRGEAWRAQPELLLSVEQLNKVVGPYKDRLRLDETQLEFVARSAIWRGTAEASFWAEKFNSAASYELLLAALSDQNDDYRLGAAKVAGQFKTRDERLFQKCLEIALTDPNTDIRRAVGEPLGHLATDAQLAEIKKLLPWHGRAPKPVRELLADMAESDRRRAGLSRVSRWRARRRYEQRICNEHVEELDRCTRAGLGAGFWGCLAWALTCLPVLLVLLRLADNPLDPTAQKWHIFNTGEGETLGYIVLAGVVLALSGWIGRQVALACGRVLVVYRQVDWSLAVRRTSFPFWLLLVVTILCLSACRMALMEALPAWSGHFVNWVPANAVFVLLILGAVLIAFAAWIVLGAAARFSCSSVGPARTEVGLLFGSFLTSMVVTVLPPGILLLPIVRLAISRLDGGSGPEDIRECYNALIIGCSFIYFITTLALLRGARAVLAESAKSVSPSRSMRKLLLAGVGGLILWIYWTYGVSTVRWLTPRLTDSTGFETSLRNWPATSSFRIQSTNRLFRVLLRGIDTRAADRRGPFRNRPLKAGDFDYEGVLFLPWETGYLSIDAVKSMRGRILEPIELDGPKVSDLSNSEPRFVQCDLRWSDKAMAWVGAIGGRVSDTNNFDRVDAWSRAEETLFSGDQPQAVAQLTNFIVRWRDYFRPEVELTNGVENGENLAPEWFTEETNIYTHAKKTFIITNNLWKADISIVPGNYRKSQAASAFEKPSAANFLQNRILPQTDQSTLALNQTAATAGQTNSVEIKTLSFLILISPGRLSAADYIRAGFQLLNGGTANDTNAAIADFTKAVEEEPENAEYQNALAWYLLLQGQLPEASEHAHLAVNRAPEEAGYWDTAAYISQGLGELKEAVYDWDKAAKLDPNWFNHHPEAKQLYGKAKATVNGAH